MKLETTVLDLQDFSTSVEVKQLSLAKLHDDLDRMCSMLNSRWRAESRALEQWGEDASVGVNTVEGRVTHLEQWGSDITASLNTVQGRVDNLEQWGEELAESL